MSQKFAWREQLPAEFLAALNDLVLSEMLPGDIARTIHDAGYMAGVSIQMLTLEMGRYRKYLKAAQPPAASAEDDDEFDPLEEMRKLAKQQQKRVKMALDKEATLQIPMDSTGKAMKEYQETLELLQSMEAKAGAKKGGKAQTLQERVTAAVRAAEDVMNARYDH